MEQIEPEEWRPCPGNNHYEVSSHGRFRAKSSGRVLSKYVRKGKISNGRMNVTLYVRSKCNRSFNSAKLIAEAFLGPRPPGLQIDHKNGIKADERVSNLHYVTQSENILRAFHVQKLNTKSVGQRRWLTDEEYEQIIALSKQGFSQVKIGKMIGRDNSTISKILSGKLRPRCDPESKFEVPIRAWLAVHPDAGRRSIAKAVGCDAKTAKRWMLQIRGEQSKQEQSC